MEAMVFVLVLIVIAALAPVLGVDSRPRLGDTRRDHGERWFPI